MTDAAAPTDDRLYERLDRIVVTTPLRANPPMWWQLMGWLQWVLGLFAVVGLAWLVVLGVFSWLQLPPIDTPKVGPFPLPTLLLLAGLVLGLLGAWVARILGRAGARHRRAVVGKRLRSAIADVATDQLVEPVRPSSTGIARRGSDSTRPAGPEPPGWLSTASVRFVPSSTGRQGALAARAGARMLGPGGAERAPSPTGNWVEEQQ